MKIARPIHIGANTHHHDQSIMLSSLSAIKRIVSRPENPMPELDEDELLLISNMFLKVNFSTIRT